MIASSPAEGHSRGHVVELDGLRGLLALWVAVSHMMLWCGFVSPFGDGRIGRVARSAIYSTDAVDAFFILSGFAITFLLCSRRTTYGRFMLGRFFRIYPVYAICLVVATVAAGLTPFVLKSAAWQPDEYLTMLGVLSRSEQAHPVAHFLAHLTLLHGLVPQFVLVRSSAALLAPAWSISVEWQFYLCAMLVIWLARSPGGVLTLLAGALLAIPVAQRWLAPLPAFFPLFLPLFLIGVASHHLYASAAARGALRRPGRTLLVIGAVAAAVVLRWHPVAMVIWAVAFGSLFVTEDDVAGRMLARVRSFLAAAVPQWLGRISYPFYLVHWPLIVASLAVTLHVRPAASAGFALAIQLLVTLPLATGAAYLLHLSVEAPCMRLGKRFTRPAARAIAAHAIPAGEVGPVLR